MKFSKILLTIIILSCISFAGHSQTMRITGTVYDTSGVKPLKNAVTMAVRIKDSLLLGYSRTDDNGNFLLTGFDIDTFTLYVDHPNYDEKVFYLFGSADNYEIEIPKIQMPDKSQNLDEVIIYANKEAIYFSGDTLIYKADSFQVHENAVVEDLLKKLPGIEVDENGAIKSQGKDVDKVLVDGDEFFGDDPTIATKNLGAKGVESVKVYEKENEDRGSGSDDKIQVLDLQLKEDYKKGYFGRISGASDFGLTYLSAGYPYEFNRSFYEGEFLFNRFSGSQKLSVFALTSNTPRSSLGWRDVRQFGLDNEAASGSRWDMGGGQAAPSGIPQTLRAGIYFSDKFGKKKRTKLNFNYSFYDEKLDATSESYSQYFLTDTSYSTNNIGRQIDENQSHRINLDFRTQLDSLTKLRIKPTVSFDKGINSTVDRVEFLSQDSVNTLNTQAENNYDGNAFNISTKVSLERKFMKDGRELYLDYDYVLDDSKTEGNLLTTSDNIALAYIDSVDQRKTNDLLKSGHYTDVEYVEPIGDFWSLSGRYQFDYTTESQEKRSYNRVGTDYNDLDSAFSNAFETLRLQHKGGVTLSFENKKHEIDFEVIFRNIDIDNVNRFTGTPVKQNVSNILPAFDYTFKPSKSKEFSFEYNTRSSQPSVDDLQPVQDNSNPNAIREGNPELLPNYVHNFRLDFSSWQVFSSQFVWTGANFSITQNAFANSVSYNQFGQSVSKTINVDGNMFGTLYAGASFPIYKQIISIRPTVNLMYNKYTNEVDANLNVTNTFTGGGGIRLNFEFDSLNFNIYNSYSYNSSVSSLNTFANTPYSNQTYGFNLRWTLPKGFVISSDAKYTINEQPGEGFYDLSYFVWNAEVSKSFLKTENLVVSIVGNDILDQNVQAARQVSGNIITDNRTEIISRYFLLKATLRFNNQKTQQKDYEGWH